MTFKRSLISFSVAFTILSSASVASAKSTRGYWWDVVGISPLGKISDMSYEGYFIAAFANGRENTLNLIPRNLSTWKDLNKNGIIHFTYTPDNGKPCHFTIKGSGEVDYANYAEVIDSDCEHSFSLVKTHYSRIYSHRYFQLKITDADHLGEPEATDISGM